MMVYDPPSVGILRKTQTEATGGFSGTTVLHRRVELVFPRNKCRVGTQDSVRLAECDRACVDGCPTLLEVFLYFLDAYRGFLGHGPPQVRVFSVKSGESIARARGVSGRPRFKNCLRSLASK